MIDRFPVIIGQNLSLSAIHNSFRLCTTGLRYQFVDVLNELIEHDPHARGVMRQRAIAVAGGRVEVHPAKLPSNHKDEALANEIAEFVDRQLDAIPRLAQNMSALQWGVYYGLSGEEILWEKAGEEWRAVELQLLHSRRLNYPYTTSWDLHVWDQGALGGIGPAPGENGYGMTFGLRIKDYPNKFVIHAPQLNGDYSIRDGEGRYLATYMALKRMVVRAVSQDFERTIRPWVLGTFNRDPEKKTKPVANKEDKDALVSVVKALGLGSLSNAVIPDSTQVQILRAATEYSPQEFIEFLNGEISKGALGQTFTTETGKFGSRSTADVGKQGSLEIARYDAKCLSDSLEQDLVRPIVRLNYDEDAARRLCPRIKIVVDELPDPKTVMELAVKGTSIDMPIDIDQLAERTGMPIIPVDDITSRRTRAIAAGKGPTPPGNDPNGPNDPNASPPPAGDKGADDDTGDGRAAPPPARAGRHPAIRGDEEADDDKAMRLCLKDRADRNVATQVYDQLLEDYPAKALHWILAGDWRGPELVPMEKIDFSQREHWRASHEPLDEYVERLAKGKIKPVVLVKRPGDGKMMIVDGHHRTLASQALGRPVLAYVADVDADYGPWDSLHAAQKKGSSKANVAGEASWLTTPAANNAQPTN